MSGPRIVVVATSSGFCAWSPDLPGCLATAETDEGARKAMRAAVAMHIEGLRKAGLPVPGDAD